MKTVLVTGACGLIGKAVCESLLEKGNIVIGTDNKPNAIGNKPNYTHVQCSISDKSCIASIFEKNKINTVIHLACSVDNDFDHIIAAEEMDLSKACDKYFYKLIASNSIKDIILLSTVQLYENTKSREPIRETGEVKASTNYAKIKYESEKALSALEKKNSDIKSVIMRVAPIYCKGYMHNLHCKVYDPKETAGVIYGDGAYSFSFCHINNIVDFVNAIVAGPKFSYGGIYNICDTKPLPAKAILDMEMDNHTISAILQKSLGTDSIKNILTGGMFSSKGEKTDYRNFDISLCSSNLCYDNTKASRLATFRWSIANIK